MSQPKTEYSKLSIKEIKEICKNNKISGYSNKKKDDIIDLLINSLNNVKINPEKNETNKNENKSVEVKEKPFLKWVGGKTQILDELTNVFPKEINNYHEIFLGGGSVLLKVLRDKKLGKIKINGNIYAYDINEPLIYIYKNIQNNHNELYLKIQELIDNFNGIKTNIVNRNANNINEAKSSRESYYFWIRKQYNSLNAEERKNIIGSAYFIFLNKTCFRGLFRLNSSGLFNVPYGNYANPEIISLDHINYIHNLIKDVIFIVSPYDLNIEKFKENDFLYLDPPYALENDKSFVSYTENGFDLEEHKNLFKCCNELNKNNIKFVMSNADVKLVRDNFTDSKYIIKSILCKRAINSKNPDAKTNEVIISNY